MATVTKPQVIKDTYKILIDGELVESAGGKTFEAISPATLEHLSNIPDGTEQDVERAVRAAQEAAPMWRRIGMQERCKLYLELASALKEKAEEIAVAEALDSGATISAMRRDIAGGIHTIEYYTGIAWELKGDTMPNSNGGMHFTLRQPHGVAASITAYNHPFSFAIHRTIGALLAGNTLVLKPPEQDSISSLMLAEVVKEIFPKGVWNIVTGFGPTVGAPLVKHPAVRRIIFTGSAATGKLIFKSAAEAGLKSVTLELGGKNPIIVFPDADLDKAVGATIAGMNFTQTAGQSCMSNSRAFVHESIHDEFVQKVADRMSKIRVGLPLDESAQMGAVVSEAQYNKVMSYIEIGKQEGATLVLGGDRPADPDLKGYYVMPTLFDNVNMNMRIANEEIFGPVLSVLPWNDEEKLLADANAVNYGLTAGIWTRDIHKALRFATEVEAGTVWINGRSGTQGMPHGGFKDSGLGRLGCMEDLMTNTQQKSVNITIE